MKKDYDFNELAVGIVDYIDKDELGLLKQQIKKRHRDLVEGVTFAVTAIQGSDRLTESGITFDELSSLVEELENSGYSVAVERSLSKKYLNENAEDFDIDDALYSALAANTFAKAPIEMAPDAWRGQNMLSIWGLPMRAGKYADVWVGVFSDAPHYRACVNGKCMSYESEASLISAIESNFKSEIPEDLTEDDSPAEFIKSALDSKDPRFANKKPVQRVDMALHAYNNRKAPKWDPTSKIKPLRKVPTDEVPAELTEVANAWVVDKPGSSAYIVEHTTEPKYSLCMNESTWCFESDKQLYKMVKLKFNKTLRESHSNAEEFYAAIGMINSRKRELEKLRKQEQTPEVVAKIKKINELLASDEEYVERTKAKHKLTEAKKKKLTIPVSQSFIRPNPSECGELSTGSTISEELESIPAYSALKALSEKQPLTEAQQEVMSKLASKMLGVIAEETSEIEDAEGTIEFTLKHLPIIVKDLQKIKTEVELEDEDILTIISAYEALVRVVDKHSPEVDKLPSDKIDDAEILDV